MRISRFLSPVAVACIVASLTGTSAAQFAAGAPGAGAMPGMSSFSPVTGAAPMGGGMSAQQQMAQIYMLYGMLGGRNNVSTGVANPFANGGFGLGSLPFLDNSAPQNYMPSAKHGGTSKKAELRALRAEQKRQAKLTKVKIPKDKPAGKTKKNAPPQQ